MKNTIGLLIILTIIIILPSCDNYINNLPKARQVYVLKSSIPNRDNLIKVIVKEACNGTVVYSAGGKDTSLPIPTFASLFKLTSQGHRKSIFE